MTTEQKVNDLVSLIVFFLTIYVNNNNDNDDDAFIFSHSVLNPLFCRPTLVTKQPSLNY